MQDRDVPAGERAGYEELYAAHYRRILRVCRLLLRDPHEAEEVGQEVFLKLYKAFHKSLTPMAWGPWLTRVAINDCRDRRRSGWWRRWRAAGEPLDDGTTSGQESTPEDEALSRETRWRIWQGLQRLSRRQREVFVLRHVEGCSTEEVAKALGLSSGSVKRHLFRAIHRLRAALGGRR